VSSLAFFAPVSRAARHSRHARLTAIAAIAAGLAPKLDTFSLKEIAAATADWDALKPPAQSATVDHGNLIGSNSAIVARIASDRLVYHVGDPIRLRLTLTNKSTDQLYIGNSPPPFALVDLQVLDFGGRPLPHGGAPWIRCMNGRSQMLSWNLSPGKPVVIGFYDPDNHWQHTDWANVKCWGYR
jgi:hypothetical protein